MNKVFYLLSILFSAASLTNNNLTYLGLGLLFSIMGVLTEIKERP